MERCHEVNTENAGLGKVFASVRWSMVGQVLDHAIRFGTSVVLARLLIPEDFGLLGMAVVITGAVGIFQTLGTHGAVIQRKDVSPELLDGIHIINLAMGLCLAASLMIGGPLFAKLYGNPQVAPIIQVLGLSFFVSAFGIVHSSLMNRDMSFARLVQIELTSSCVQGATAMSLAYLGWNVWALVGGNLTGSTITTSLLCWFSSWRPRWRFSWREIKNIARYSLNLTGVNSVDYFFRNTDKFVVGRFLGSVSLGYYWMAFNLCTVPVDALVRVLGRVLFPAFSRIQDDDKQLRIILLRAIGLSALVTFPMVLGLALIAHPFIVGVFGEKWGAASPLIAILAPVVILQTMTSSTGNIYLAKGRANWLFWLNFATGIVSAVAYLFGLHWGIIGVASAYSIVMLPLAYVHLLIAFRLIGARFGGFFATLRPYLLANIVMGVLVLGCRLALEANGFSPVEVLIATVPVGMTSYMAMILFTRPTAVIDLASMFPQRFRSTKLWALLLPDETKSV